jgi:hypothetical protein
MLGSKVPHLPQLEVTRDEHSSTCGGPNENYIITTTTLSLSPLKFFADVLLGACCFTRKTRI